MSNEILRSSWTLDDIRIFLEFNPAKQTYVVATRWAILASFSNINDAIVLFEAVEMSEDTSKAFTKAIMREMDRTHTSPPCRISPCPYHFNSGRRRKAYHWPSPCDLWKQRQCSCMEMKCLIDMLPNRMPPFPPVKVIRCGKHVGYETLDGEFIPVSPSSNEVPTQWIVLFAFVFLFGVAIGYFVL